VSTKQTFEAEVQMRKHRLKLQIRSAQMERIANLRELGRIIGRELPIPAHLEHLRDAQ
jgi:hypothetical protein